MHLHIAAVRNGLIRVLSYGRVWLSLLIGFCFMWAAHWLVFPRLVPMFVWPAMAFILLSGGIGALFEWQARASPASTRPPESLTPGNSLAVVFLILATASGISTVYGWFHSVDVRGWWPLVLAISLFIDCIYSLVFVAISRFGRPFGWRFVVVYNAALGLLIVGQHVLFYAKVTGSPLGGPLWRLSLSLQRAARSDSSFYALYAVFLLFAAMLARTRRGRRR